VKMLRPWPTKVSRPLADYRVFTVRSDLKTSPRTGNEHDFFVIDCVNWVNVIALTPDDKMVMVEQYRHGSNTIELEIPGGMMDGGEGPLETGCRELREETGYVGENPLVIGQNYPNPAIMTNTCFTLCVRNCACTHATELDPGEDIATRLIPLAQIPELVANGTILHSLVIVALYQFNLWRKP